MKKYLALLAILIANAVYADNTDTNKSVEDNNGVASINKTKIDNDGIQEFKNALDKYQFSTARKIALDNKAIIEPILLKYSEEGLTPVQWMYAEYLLNIDSLQESAKWVYIALFNTRFDLNLCRDNKIIYLEKNILQSWTKIVDNAKNNNFIKQKALDGATSFIKDKYQTNNYIKNKNPNWVCLYSYTGSNEPLIIKKESWSDIYRKVMNDYFSKYDHE